MNCKSADFLRDHDDHIPMAPPMWYLAENKAMVRTGDGCCRPKPTRNEHAYVPLRQLARPPPLALCTRSAAGCLHDPTTVFPRF